MSLEEKMKKYMDKFDIPTPIYECQIGNVSFFVWKYAEFFAEAVETEPYQLDGSMPLIMIQFAWFEMMFENKMIYKFLYKRKWKFSPRGLD